MVDALPEIACPRCKTSLAPLPTPHQTFVCAQCQSETELWLFPACLAKDSEGAHRPELAVDDASRCYFHDSHQAERVCDGCGRFLCGLCAIEWGNHHLCTTCIEAQNLPDDAKISGRTVYRYDVIALYLMVACIFAWFISFVIYPAALFFLYRAYTQPVSLVERWSWARVGATLFAVVYLLGAGFFILTILGMPYE